MQIYNYALLVCITVGCSQLKIKSISNKDTLNQIDARGRKQGYWKDDFDYKKFGEKPLYIYYYRYVDDKKQGDVVVTDTLNNLISKHIKNGNNFFDYDKNGFIVSQEIMLLPNDTLNKSAKVTIFYKDFHKGLISGIVQNKDMNNISINFHKNGGIAEISEDIYYIRGNVKQSIQKKIDSNGNLLQVKDYGYEPILVEEIFETNEKKWDSGKGKKINEIDFYPNGNVKNKKYYRFFYHMTFEEPEGTWQYFSESGELIKEEFYQYGKLIKTKEYK